MESGISLNRRALWAGIAVIGVLSAGSPKPLLAQDALHTDIGDIDKSTDADIFPKKRPLLSLCRTELPDAAALQVRPRREHGFPHQPRDGGRRQFWGQSLVLRTERGSRNAFLHAESENRCLHHGLGADGVGLRRRLGRGKHARVDLRCNETPRDLRDDRPAYLIGSVSAFWVVQRIAGFYGFAARHRRTAYSQIKHPVRSDRNPGQTRAICSDRGNSDIFFGLPSKKTSA